MVQISKLTKGELAITGFKNRSIASRFMKQILNKKGRDFKDKVELINELTSKYFEMKNYGIDLNDIAKIERTDKKAEKMLKNHKKNLKNLK
jgi:flavodoxin